MKNEPTPRTDSTMKYCFGDDQEYVKVEFVQGMERELNQSRRDLNVIMKMAKKWLKEEEARSPSKIMKSIVSRSQESLYEPTLF